MDAETAKQIVALQCAVRMMDGTAGGYTKDQIYDSKIILMNLIATLKERPK